MVEAFDLLAAPILVLVPHFDDEVLGCGGSLSQLKDPAMVHFLYATDAGGSETNHIPGKRYELARDIREIRRAESLAALKVLGLDAAQATFMDIPDFGVAARIDDIRRQAGKIVADRGIKTIVAPFRYDRHPDHVGLNRIAMDLVRERAGSLTLTEYFIYFRWRFIPGGDLRRWLRPECLCTVNISEVGEVKRRALECFKSQVTCCQSWQTKPVLSAETVDLFSRGPEMFCVAGPVPDRRLFRLPPLWIRMCHGIEPWLKIRKETVRQRIGV